MRSLSLFKKSDAGPNFSRNYKIVTKYSLPPKIENWINCQLNFLGVSLADSKQLAQSVKRMADFYVENPSKPTPWHEVWCQQAQLAYYFPLNFLRNLRVFEELKAQNFFRTPFTWHEFGAGLGPSLEAFLSLQLPANLLRNTQLTESSKQARQLCQGRMESHYNINLKWQPQVTSPLDLNSLLVLSYSLTELDQLPDWLWNAHSIIILEPATREDGRRLMELRQHALEKSYHIVAPCTHALNCPLLINSQRDWCHDRFAFDRPEWMLKLEEYLPFVNSTLTVSYLALTKRDKESKLYSDHSRIRVVGDFLNEKGKTRQMICRNENREFLTFLKKVSTPPEFYRGDILSIEEPISKRAEELRVEPHQINVIKPSPK
jgi:hypothetical protein